MSMSTEFQCPQTKRLIYSERIDCPYIEVMDIVETEGRDSSSFKEKRQFYTDSEAIESYIRLHPDMRGWIATTKKDNYRMMRLFYHLGARAYGMNDEIIYFRKELKYE